MLKRACELFSKRSSEITAAVESKGYDTYQARQTAARDTRKHKRHTPPEDLMDGWVRELASAGYTPAGLLQSVEVAGARRRQLAPAVLSQRQLQTLAQAALGPDGRLAQEKVFSRPDVTVALGPLLFGCQPRELLRAVEAVCAHPDAIALLGVKAAREQAFAPACVIATEAAIARNVAAQSSKTGAPAVSPVATEAAITAKETELGRSLTGGQQAMVRAVATSGRPVELIVGVAGAGKTTAIDAARRAFESAGYRVVGTSTSGQAARTLGTEAAIDESRTIASLLWRMDHGLARLDPKTVVVCDEAGMCDDPAMLRLLKETEAAGAKLIMVGDHRQLGSVGPGGSLEALVQRHAGSVHVLGENVRQADPDERRALAHLRAGNVATAVNWYRDHDRIDAGDRNQALDQTVTAWAKDQGEGKRSTMMAWRRANVAELNTRARQASVEAGRLIGPELKVEDAVYQAGDRVVTLSPSAHGQLVTSQRGEVTAADPDAGRLTVRMDDGRVHILGREQIGPDQLAHGYATTVHRSQGATFDTAHLFADGGGRELSYVAMSRARQKAHVHVVADDVDQAVEDLNSDWCRERRQIWAIDTGTPARGGRHPLEVEADAQVPVKLSTALGRALLKAERTALRETAAGSPDHCIQRQVAALDRHIQLLDQRLDHGAQRPDQNLRSTGYEPPQPDRGVGLSL